MGKYVRGEYKKFDVVCDVCKNTFQGTSKAKFCSNKCKQKDKYNKTKKSK